MRSWLASIVLASALLGASFTPALAGDSKAKAKAKINAKAEINAKAKAAARTGNVAGTVHFKGKPPSRTVLDRSSDPVCSATTTLSEDIVVTGSALRDVMVMVPSGSTGAHTAPAAPVVITQRDCTYLPRVVGIMADQPLAVDNSDPTYHNVRGNLAKKILWNLGQPAKAPRIVRDKVGKVGDVVSLHCDVHPWMRSFAVVTDHPFFSVTGADGSFSLTGVPAGTYELQAWHPVLGKITTKVRVKAGVTAKVDFEFSSANLPRR